MAHLHSLSRLAMVPIAPVLFAQGRRLKRSAERLPDAAFPWSGNYRPHGSSHTLKLLVLGDSTAAGVGAAHQGEALPGHLAHELSMLRRMDVAYRAIGESGGTSRDIVARHLDEATADSYDIIFLTIGANDALAIRSRVAFARDIRLILDRLRAASPNATILMSSLPAFFRFELLPNPLRWNLYLHSQSLEAAARQVVAQMPGVFMSPPPPPYTEGFFASDLFHPSAKGYRDWAEFAVSDAVAQGALS